MKKTKNTVSRSKENKPNTAKKEIKFDPKILNIIATGLFYFATIILLAVYWKDLLFRIEEFSIFITDALFFRSFMEQPAGLLFYLGSFITQFLYYPWLGSLLLVILLSLIQFLTYKCFSLSGNSFLLTLVPGTLLLISLFQLDYSIFILNDRLFIISQFVGFLILLFGFYLYRIIRSSKLKIIFVVFWTLFAYPLFGLFSLISTLLMVVYEIIRKELTWKQKLPIMICGVLSVILIPLGYYAFVYDVINPRSIYLYGLPILDFSLTRKIWIPTVLLFVSLFFFLFSYIKRSKKNPGIASFALNTCCFVICIVSIFVFANKDENFRTVLKMERALEDQNYDKIIQIAEQNKAKYPVTRAIVTYRNIALFNKGLLLDRSFVYSNESEAYHSSVPITGTRIAGIPVFYHYGKVNFSYRWCMESLVQNGSSAYCYKYMAKIALLNNESELAKKYLNTLKKTIFHKKWAKKYEAYLENSALQEQDEELKAIRSLMQFPGNKPESSLLAESSVLEFYNELEGGSPNMLIHALNAALTMRNSDSFWYKLQAYITYNPGKPLPMHLQEAAAMYGSIEGKDLSPLNLDQTIVHRYEEFMKLAQQFNREPDEEMKAVFRKRFGSTYWFYYFFIQEIKIS